MTDAETFAAICADFPFDIETLDALHKRLDRVLGKSPAEKLYPKQGKK